MNGSYFKTKIGSVILLFVCCVQLIGCEGRDFNRYYGEYPQGFTMAINSILGEAGDDRSKLVVMDEDSYGRVMYVYGNDLHPDKYEDVQGKYTCLFAVLIAQSISEESVCYYEDQNFLLFTYETDVTIYSISEDEMLNIIEQLLSEDEFAQFKDKNDWNQNLNPDGWVEKAVVRKSKTYKNFGLVKEKVLETTYLQLYPGKTYKHFYSATYCTSDNYNRHLYFFLPDYFLASDDDQFYVAAFYDNKLLSYVEIADRYDYSETLSSFKESISWNEPIEE